jgi:hypothetical protein
MNSTKNRDIASRSKAQQVGALLNQQVDRDAIGAGSDANAFCIEPSFANLQLFLNDRQHHVVRIHSIINYSAVKKPGGDHRMDSSNETTEEGGQRTEQ